MRTDSGPCFELVGLGVVVARESLLIVWAAVAILEGVIEQLLHLPSKYLLSAKHLAGCERTWSLATWSLQFRGGGDNKHTHAYYT